MSVPLRRTSASPVGSQCREVISPLPIRSRQILQAMSIKASQAGYSSAMGSGETILRPPQLFAFKAEVEQCHLHQPCWLVSCMMQSCVYTGIRQRYWTRAKVVLRLCVVIRSTFRKATSWPSVLVPEASTLIQQRRSTLPRMRCVCM